MLAVRRVDDRLARRQMLGRALGQRPAFCYNAAPVAFGQVLASCRLPQRGRKLRSRFAFCCRPAALDHGRSVSNFARVIRIALRHRLTVLASVLCSVGVAVLWAGNIAAIMPLVDGVMHEKTIPVLCREYIAAQEERIHALDEKVKLYDHAIATVGDDAQREQKLRRKLARVQDKRIDEVEWLALYQRALPVLEDWLPITPFGTLVLICVGLAISTILKSMLRIAGLFFMARLGHLTSFDLRKEFYRRTLALDMGTFSQSSTGDLMNRFTTDVGSIAFGTNVLFGMAILEPLKLVACLIGAALISWQLLLLSVLFAPLAGYAVHWMAKSLKRANRRALQELSSLYEHLEETFSSMKVIKAFTRESRERSRFHQASKQFYRRSMKIAFYDSLVSPMTETMGVVVIMCVVMAGGFLVLNDQTAPVWHSRQRRAALARHADRLLRHVARRDRPFPSAVGCVQSSAACGCGERSGVRDARSHLAGRRSARARQIAVATGPHQPSAMFRSRTIPTNWSSTVSACKSSPARRSPSSAPTAAVNRL